MFLEIELTSEGDPCWCHELLASSFTQSLKNAQICNIWEEIEDERVHENFDAGVIFTLNGISAAAHKPYNAKKNENFVNF